MLLWPLLLLRQFRSRRGSDLASCDGHAVADTWCIALEFWMYYHNEVCLKSTTFECKLPHCIQAHPAIETDDDTHGLEERKLRFRGVKILRT